MRGVPRGESASRSEQRGARVQRSRTLPRSGRLRTPAQFAALAGEAVVWRAARQWVAAAARVEPHPAESSEEACVQPNAQYEAPREAPPPESAVGRIRAADARPGGARGIRFGFTVGRRQARRAVLRVMVKRVLRESARNGAALLCQLSRGRRIDVVLRLRSPLPDPSGMGLSQLKRSLREEADSLIEQLGRHLAGGAAARRGGPR